MKIQHRKISLIATVIFLLNPFSSQALDRWPTPSSERTDSVCEKKTGSEAKLEALKQEWLALEEKTQGGVFFSSTQEANRLHTLRVIMHTNNQLGKKR